MTIKAVHTLYRMFDADEQLLYIGITMDDTVAQPCMDHPGIREEWT